MSDKHDNNWHVSAAVGVIAFMAGAALAQFGPTFRAVQKMDGTTVAESVVGAGIPLALTAAVGVFIGRRLSKNAALELQDALEDQNDKRERKRADIQTKERLARMSAWNDVHHACMRLLSPGAMEATSYAHAVAVAAGQTWRQENLMLTLFLGHLITRETV